MESLLKTEWFIMTLGIVLSSFVLLSMLGFFFIYKKARLKKAWLAFIPIYPFCVIPYFHAIHKNAGQMVKWLIPVAGIYFMVRDQADFYRAYGLKVPLSLLLSYFVPFGAFIIHFYMAFSKEVTYEKGPSAFQK